MEQAKWTVMIYFAGPNRLGDYMVYALKEIKSVRGLDHKLNLLAEFDSSKVTKQQSTQTNFPTPLRFEFKNQENPRESVFESRIEPPPQSEKPTCQGVKPDSSMEHMSDFIVWAVTHYPAEKYVLILSGDGGGPVVPFLPSNSEPGQSFGPGDLALVFNCVNERLGEELTIDVLGLDSCLMSMAEVAFEVRDYADYFVSSQANIDDMGWPYRNILEDLKAKIDDPHFGPKDFSRTIVEDYVGYYVDYGVIAKRSTHLSALRLDRFDHLARNVKSFTDAANDILPAIEEPDEGHCSDELEGVVKLFAALLVRAHWRSQSYRNDQYTDLFDFCQLLKADLEGDSWVHLEPHDRAKLKRVARACDRIMKTLCGSGDCTSADSDSLVVRTCYAGVENQYSHGLSLYFPWHRIVEGYFPYRCQDGSFAMVTCWLEFLRRYLCATRRPERESMHESSKFFRRFFFEKDPPEGRDPPEGKGSCVCESTKNGPSSWSIPNCVPETNVIE
jgi:hypothetical protein